MTHFYFDTDRESRLVKHLSESLHSKHDALTQCCFIVGPPSKRGRRWLNIEPALGQCIVLTGVILYAHSEMSGGSFQLTHPFRSLQLTMYKRSFITPKNKSFYSSLFLYTNK